MKKEILGFKGYYVDELGNVYGRQKKILTPVIVSGYQRVSLPNSDGTFSGHLIHRLVAMAFIPNENNLPEVNHINGNKQDNNVANLEWVTKSENQLHRIHVLGKGLDGENNPRHKITESDVKQILKMKQEGLSHSKVAKIMGLSKTTISDICSGKSWNNITGLPKTRCYNRWTKKEKL